LSLPTHFRLTGCRLTGCRLTGLALLAAAALAPTQAAQAQTYSYRTLPVPSGAHACFLDRNVGPVLNDKGEVAGRCDYFTGYVWDYSNFIPRLVSTYGNAKPFVWSATGTSRALSVPTGTAYPGLHGISIDNNSKARAVTLPTPTSNGLGLVWVWQGTQRSVWAPPAASAGNWDVRWFSPGGKVLALGADTIGVFSDTGAAIAPLPPVPEVSRRNDAWGVVNDAGQIAYYFDEITPTTPGSGQLWTWRSGSWTKITGPQAFPSYPQPRLDVSSTGQVMASNSGESIYGSKDILWRDGQLQNLPEVGGPHAYSALAPASVDVVGWLPNKLDERRATLWRNGVAIDLNAQVKLPSGWVLNKAYDINARGQIVVSAGARLVLLTPQ